MQLDLIASNPELQVYMNFDWSCTAFTETKMEIQLDFEYREQISIDFPDKDVLQMTVIDPTLFRSSISLL